MPLSLESIADRIRQHPKLVIADDFEIGVQHTASNGVRYHNGELRQQSEGDRLWVSLRIHHRKRGGRSVCFNQSIESIQGLVDAAFEGANRAAVDPWFRFPIWKSLPKAAPEPEAPANLYGSLFNNAPRECSAFDEAYDVLTTRTLLRRKTERIELRHTLHSHLASFSVIARAGNEVIYLREERGQSGSLRDRQSYLESLTTAIAGRAKRPAKPCGRGRRRALFAPRVAASFLRVMAPWFSAQSIQAGRSPLTGLMGTMAFSEALTLWDDGNHPGSPWSAPFDLEGTASQKTCLVQKGVAKTNLFDVYCATRENRLSTGNFLRAPADAYPSIQASTLYLEPGERNLSGLLNDMGNGIYLDCLDSIELSAESPSKAAFNGSGWRVAFGECAEPLQGITGEIDLLELFRRASGVGSDISFFAGVGSPSILFENVPLGN